MSSSASPPDTDPKQPLWRKAEQAALAIICTAALLGMLIAWWWQGGHRGRLIEIDRAAPTDIKFTVDVNSADWPELAQLPDIGEALARRIVDERKAVGPYHSPNDLQQRVNGIGPKTLAKIEPYLRPIPPQEVLVDRTETQ